LFTRFEQFKKKLHLHHRLSAGKSNPTSGLIIEDPIPYYLVQHNVRGYRLTDPIWLPDKPELRIMTSLLKAPVFQNRLPAFWIVTPPAFQLTSVKKDRGTNARTIMNGIFLYIEYVSD